MEENKVYKGVNERPWRKKGGKENYNFKIKKKIFKIMKETKLEKHSRGS